MLPDHPGDKEMMLAEFPLQGGQQLVPWGAQSPGVGQRLFRRPTVEQTVDPSPSRPTMGVGDDRREADTGIAQHPHQAVFLRRQQGGGPVVLAAELA